MLNTTHLNDSEADKVTKALKKTEHDITSNADDTVNFYLNDKQYTEVHIVRCNKCKKDLCLEVLNPHEAPRYLTSHHKGCRRIVLGTNGPLLSSRKRLDGLMGYRCMCGNNTIIAEIEKGLVPQVKAPVMHIPTIEPHHEAMIKLQMAKSGHKPDIEISADGKTVRQETFTTERLR